MLSRQDHLDGPANQMSGWLSNQEQAALAEVQELVHSLANMQARFEANLTASAARLAEFERVRDEQLRSVGGVLGDLAEHIAQMRQQHSDGLDKVERFRSRLGRDYVGALVRNAAAISMVTGVISGLISSAWITLYVHRYLGGEWLWEIFF